MNNIETYILEKLKLGKNTQVSLYAESLDELINKYEFKNCISDYAPEQYKTYNFKTKASTNICDTLIKFCKIHHNNDYWSNESNEFLIDILKELNFKNYNDYISTISYFATTKTCYISIYKNKTMKLIICFDCTSKTKIKITYTKIKRINNFEKIGCQLIDYILTNYE